MVRQSESVMISGVRRDKGPITYVGALQLIVVVRTHQFAYVFKTRSEIKK